MLSVDVVRNLVIDPAITSISFWSDNGKHFHSNKFLYFPLVELVNDSDLGITDVDVSTDRIRVGPGAYVPADVAVVVDVVAAPWAWKGRAVGGITWSP